MKLVFLQKPQPTQGGFTIMNEPGSLSHGQNPGMIACKKGVASLHSSVRFAPETDFKDDEAQEQLKRIDDHGLGPFPVKGLDLGKRQVLIRDKHNELVRADSHTLYVC
jgi:hypothetical protein